MPEIAEVARIVHFLRQNLVGKTISKAVAVDDANIFGKAGTSGAAIEAALKQRTVVAAGSQGKYFWVTLDQPPHVVIHFGMTGWVHIKGQRTAYTNYYKKNPADDQWPPKFWKFHLSTTCDPPVEVAFTDPRRFGRVRLVHCAGDMIRNHSPLVENGPDPVVDADRFTEEYLRGKMKGRRVPVKSLLLDQTVISGIGNWVADETLYQAKLHPEQYSDTFSDEQIAALHASIRMVCQTAVDVLGDSDEFPKDWLFNYRWGKGGKGGKGAASVLPNGERIAFITVGGRTSCIAPAVQRKTGAGTEGAKVELVEEKPQKTKTKKAAMKGEVEKDGEPRKRKRSESAAMNVAQVTKKVVEVEDGGRRRSNRLRKVEITDGTIR